MKRANQKQKELVVIAEDEATSRLAQGFLMNTVAIRQNRYDIKKYCKGWKDAAELAKAVNLDRNAERYLLIVIDFDRADEKRYDRIISEMQKGGVDLSRVFVIGAATEAEPLRNELCGYYHDRSLSFEGLGNALAEDCRNNKRPGAWEYVDSLKHNCPEIARLEQDVKPFLFC